MKTERGRIFIIIGICVGVLFFANGLKAQEDDLYQELIDSGVSVEDAEYILNGPEGTLGERAETMLKNGTITERQYEKAYNHLMALPEAKRQAIKGVYDEGGADKLYDATTGIAHRKLGEPTVRERAHELRQQGLARDQILERLRNEGVSVDHLKDLGYGPAGDPSRVEHYKDVRDMDTEEAQHIVDRIHEKKQEIKDEASRPGHIKDRGEDKRDRREDKRS